MSENISTDTTVLTARNEHIIRKKLKDADFDSAAFREYSLHHPKRGRAVIANYHEFKDPKLTRDGSEVDVNRLKDILQDKLNFTVDIWETKGVDADQFLRMVKEEAARKDHEESDCFVMVLMTHGKEGGKLMSYREEFKLDQVVESFTGDKCEGLCGKPKIFIVQACRGDKSQTGVPNRPKMISKGPSPPKPPPPPEVITLPTHSDFVIAQSQFEGFYSHRSTIHGSYFIQALCDILEHDIKKPDNEKGDLLKLLTLTSQCVAYFEFIEYSTPESRRDGGDGDEDVARDTSPPLEGSAESSAVVRDANPFLKPGLGKYQAKLVKQQPMIVSTMLKQFYLRNKVVQKEDKDPGQKEK